MVPWAFTLPDGVLVMTGPPLSPVPTATPPFVDFASSVLYANGAPVGLMRTWTAVTLTLQYSPVAAPSVQTCRPTWFEPAPATALLCGMPAFQGPTYTLPPSHV